MSGPPEPNYEIDWMSLLAWPKDPVVAVEQDEDWWWLSTDGHGETDYPHRGDR